MNDLIQTIKKGEYTFQSDEWFKVSPEAKNLIQKLIVVDPKKRLIPSTALKHKWLADAPSELEAVLFHKKTLPIQKNLKKNKRRLTKSNMNIANNKRVSFNMDIKSAWENVEVVHNLRLENDNQGSFTDSDPASIEEMLDED